MCMHEFEAGCAMTQTVGHGSIRFMDAAADWSAQFLRKGFRPAAGEKIAFLEHLETSLDDMDGENGQLPTRAARVAIFNSFRDVLGRNF